MNLTPLARAIARHYGFRHPRASLSMRHYLIAGGPSLFLKVVA